MNIIHRGGGWWYCVIVIAPYCQGGEIIATESNANSPTPETITTGIIFVDLVNSVQLSEMLSPDEYNVLIDDFQGCMNDSVEWLKSQKYQNGKSFQIGDFKIVGDQLVLFLHEFSEIETSKQLMVDSSSLRGDRKSFLKKEFRQLQSTILMELLLSAINIKTRWMIHEHNLLP